MVKLTAKNDWQHATWYFLNMEQCDVFKQVFVDHWCIINWNPVEIISDSDIDKCNISEFQKNELDVDPKTRAERSLKWGFNSYMADHQRELTHSQRQFIDNLVDTITGS